MRRRILDRILSPTLSRMASSSSSTTSAAPPPPPASSASTSNSKLICTSSSPPLPAQRPTLLRPPLQLTPLLQSQDAPSGTKTSAPGQADQYTLSTLSRSSLHPDPLNQFHTWFAAAQSHPVPLPESVCLSTASLPSGRVSSRFVYLKELDARGFVVYSHWGPPGGAGGGASRSRKAADIASNPHASLAFWWREMERQVRVDGPVERLTAAESQAYFDLRARGSRIGAWASRQSAVLPPDPHPDRTPAGAAAAAERGQPGEAEEPEGEEENDGRFLLDRRVREIEQRFAGVDKIPCPDFWGGLRVVPDTIEFWQGRDSRLHDRFLYTRITDADAKEGEAGWRIERLSP